MVPIAASYRAALGGAPVQDPARALAPGPVAPHRVERPPMELRHLRYFVAAAEAGHVGRAAARLHVSQPALSKQLADLERELGVRLLDRHPRGVRPTRAGGELLRHARVLLADAARAVEHVRRAGGAGATLRVGVIGFGEIGAGEALVRRALAAFRTTYPHARVELDLRPFYYHAEAVRVGRLDVGFHVGLAPGAPELAAERVHRDALAGVLLPAEHPLAAATLVDPADLVQLECVDFPPWCAPREHEDEYGRLAAAGWRGRLNLEVEHVGTMLSAVAAGGAWLQSIPWIENAAPPPGVVYRTLAGGSGSARDVYALTRLDAGGPDDPLARAFLGCLVAERAAPAAALS